MMRPAWPRWPRRTVRLRLTLLYGGLFLLCGAGLLAITYVLLSEHGPGVHIGSPGRTGGAVLGPVLGPTGVTSIPRQFKARQCPARLDPLPTASQITRCIAFGRAVASQERAAELRQLLTESGIALGIMAVASIGLGWLVAGRVLRPLRTITAAARSVSASNLHARLALAGPDDELKELGDTFDGLLSRLEAAFGAQRRFVANASHELRSPLARQRTLIEVALADPDAPASALRQTCTRVLDAGIKQERLIEALLTLARTQRGLDRCEPVDLTAIADEAVAGCNALAMSRGVTVRASGGDAKAMGDERLIERLVANLVDNAVRHNVPGGSVQVRTWTAAGESLLSVVNSGPVVAPGDVGQLFEPFRRGAGRTAGGDGLGLGLSIVAAIAAAHVAKLETHAPAGGGLRITVTFRSASSSPLTDRADFTRV